MNPQTNSTTQPILLDNPRPHNNPYQIPDFSLWYTAHGKRYNHTKSPSVLNAMEIAYYTGAVAALETRFTRLYPSTPTSKKQ